MVNNNWVNTLSDQIADILNVTDDIGCQVEQIMQVITENTLVIHPGSELPEEAGWYVVQTSWVNPQTKERNFIWLVCQYVIEETDKHSYEGWIPPQEYSPWWNEDKLEKWVKL